MKFSINQSELNKALSIVSKVPSNNSTLAVLSGIHITAVENEIILEATNLVLSIKHHVPALVEEQGDTVVSAKLLQDIVKGLPDMAVRIEAEPGTVNVYCNTTTISLRALDPEDFPAFPEIQITQKAQFPFDAFSAMVKATSKIVSRDETRIALTGVLIAYEGTKLRMVATDSYRLAVSDTELETAADEPFEVLVDGRFLSNIASLTQSDEPIEVGTNDNQIIVKYQNTTFINRRIEAAYPNYRSLILTDYKTKVTLPTASLIDAVRRVSLLSSSVTPVQISIDAESGVMSLMTSSNDIGNALETLICDIEGESSEISFNHGYLLDGLASVKSDVVELQLFGTMKPGILRATKDEDFLYVIMPMRV